MTGNPPTRPDRWRAPRELARQAFRRLRGGELTPARAGLSVALGLAIGVTPAFGFHWLLVLGLAVPLRLDTGVCYLAANISIPVIAPFLTFAELELGARILHGAWLGLRPRDVGALDLRTLVAELGVGTAVLAPSAGTLGGATTYALVAWRRRVSASRAGPTSPSEPGSAVTTSASNTRPK